MSKRGGYQERRIQTCPFCDGAISENLPSHLRYRCSEIGE